MRKGLHRIKTLVVLSLALVFFGGGYGEAATAAPRSTAALESAIKSGKKTVVFFLNPNGRPCQLQNAELEKLKRDVGGSINVVYVSVLEPQSQKAFYDYGIRSMPSLVLIDGKGGIARHMPPGIHSYETLLAALKDIK
jgi:thioredoxin 1